MTTKSKVIYLAGGCFWGTEHFLKQIRGVQDTQVGYANGKTERPTYEEVCTGRTGFAEAVRVDYDPEVLPLEKLLSLYYETIDPTILNRQGNDQGAQYRTGIYWVDAEDEAIIRASLSELAKQYTKSIVVECLPLSNYYDAEDYHQDYLDKNPTGYCHIPSALFERAKTANTEAGNALTFKKLSDEELKAQLTSIQYDVTQRNATEPAFNNDYWDEKRDGIYVDITTGEPLFVSTDKYDSGCGWPSFSKPITEDLIQEKDDLSHGMKRIEVRSKRGDSHLGHVFNDGPKELGGLRYCINSASLRFVPRDSMELQGYGSYLPLLEPQKTK